MRYHWGQGIGHRYAFTSMTTESESDSIHDEAEEAENDQYPELDEDSEGASDTDESNNSELSLGDEGWEDIETSDGGSDSDSPSERDSESDED